ncbi:MAG: ParB/RepB/Spo0J family partition protein [Nitrosomonadales bacterium]|nr:ParB/RepB/Spo0J family partition protein [Nitrosomonadales bacterium]
MVKANKGLGRGLDALLSGNAKETDDVLRELKVGQLKPGKYQPRTHMDEVSLNELAASIKEQGVIQPILARMLSDDSYEIIAGERRWRAAQLAGLNQVPVLVRKVADNAALAMALIENIQRENLNPLEEAAGIQRLIHEFKMTHQSAADAVGRSRSAASNLLRLLKLPQPVQSMLMDGRLDMGHARALLSLDGAHQITAANKIATAGLSVREAEKLAQDWLSPAPKHQKPHLSRDAARLQEKLADHLGTKVTIQHKAKNAGKLVIEYTSLDQLDGILAKMGVSKDS